MRAPLCGCAPALLRWAGQPAPQQLLARSSAGVVVALYAGSRSSTLALALNLPARPRPPPPPPPPPPARSVQVGQSNKERRVVKAEVLDARKALVPFLQAEEDRR